MCPIAQGASSLSAIWTALLPMCPIAHVPHCSCVKKMSSCQKDVKCQKVKYMDYGRDSQKIKLT